VRHSKKKKKKKKKCNLRNHCRGIPYLTLRDQNNRGLVRKRGFFFVNSQEKREKKRKGTGTRGEYRKRGEQKAESCGGRKRWGKKELRRDRGTLSQHSRKKAGKPKGWNPEFPLQTLDGNSDHLQNYGGSKTQMYGIQTPRVTPGLNLSRRRKEENAAH